MAEPISTPEEAKASAGVVGLSCTRVHASSLRRGTGYSDILAGGAF
jgi:hypothetical protein